MTSDDLEELHYITHMERGIFSHKKAERISHQSVAMDEIQDKRKKVVVPGGREESKSKLYDIMEEIEPDFSITVNPDLFFQ